MSERKFTTESISKPIKVIFKGETIVESEQATLMHEGSHTPVHYFPRSDAKMGFLKRTEHHSH